MFEVIADDKSSVIVVGSEYDPEIKMDVPVFVFVCGECSKYIPFSAAAEGKDESI